MTDLNAAFAALSPDDRAVLVMCALEGLSGDEIATRLGIRSGAVRTRLHRARERFRKLYEGES
jgi:RNA polymerase sigma-70 factor (ECF subfamily)